MRQRLAAGLLRRIGMTETIAVDADDYVSKAAALARDPNSRGALRARLQASAPLADEDIAVVRAFETTILGALAGCERVFGG